MSDPPLTCNQYLSAHEYLLDTGPLPPELLAATNAAFCCAAIGHLAARGYERWYSDQTCRGLLEILIPWVDQAETALKTGGPLILDRTQAFARVRATPYEPPTDALNICPTSAHVAAVHIADSVSQAIRNALKGLPPLDPKRLVVLTLGDVRKLNKEIAFEAATLAPAEWETIGERLAPKKPKKRRRKTPRKPAPLTPEQTEAMQLVGEHKGNIAAAARAAGKTRQAMERLYKKALKKLGKSVLPKPRTQGLPIDRRGQETVADEEE